MAEMVYAVHTRTCTYMLDEEGVCGWVLSPSGSEAQDRCMGAQFVACLDLRVDGGLVGELRVGAAGLFVRRESGRFVLLKTSVIERIDYQGPGAYQQDGEMTLTVPLWSSTSFAGELAAEVVGAAWKPVTVPLVSPPGSEGAGRSTLPPQPLPPLPVVRGRSEVPPAPSFAGARGRSAAPPPPSPSVAGTRGRSVAPPPPPPPSPAKGRSVPAPPNPPPAGGRSSVPPPPPRGARGGAAGALPLGPARHGGSWEADDAMELMPESDDTPPMSLSASDIEAISTWSGEETRQIPHDQPEHHEDPPRGLSPPTPSWWSGEEDEGRGR
ncbi:hypothetical protein [Chondromyces crocatus]|uniref:Uncharacterized protein n=1 Tax=Chondromyces crocatus TaxID=52 RepID=A0A0K1ELF7_CHOCO|nr:hypothetical protein [Chondromyces crocatus]AKT41715.1 uncharacterized protein CMC5_059260 [Chondromyces crocatus]